MVIPGLTDPRTSDTGERAQAHTLEAFTAALLLVSSLAFALQITAVTPHLASTSSQHAENQRAAMAGGLLDAAAENGSLREALLDWNDSTGAFVNASEGGYYHRPGRANNTFGAMLERTFLDRGIAASVTVSYVTGNGTLRSRRMVSLGTPGDHAVSVSRDVTLYDDDELHGGPTTLQDSGSYFAPDTSAGSVYSVVRVEVTVWRR